MNSIQNYTRTVGLLAVLSGLLALICNLLLALAVRFDLEAFAEPARLFSGFSAQQASYFRWGMITDLWGYYLLLTPVVVFCYERMTSPWRRVYALSGLAYIFLGASGAAILAAAGGDVLRAYAAADAAGQAGFKSEFLLLYRVVNDSIWNLLEMGLFGIFCLGAASLWSGTRPLYYLTIVLGVVAMLDSLAHTLEWPGVAEVSLNAYLLLAPIWAIWLGWRWIAGKMI